MPRHPHPSGARRRDRFLERVAAVWGMRPEDAARRLTGDRRSSLRINPLAGRPVDAIGRDVEALTELEPIAWCPDAFHIRGDKRAITESAPHAAGEVYVMNASSLVPALALDPRPDQDIFDVCAAPGGKSAHIAALTGNRARLHLNDGIKSRLKKLREVIDLLNIDVVSMTDHPGQYLDKFVDAEFDRILLDAQCSGEGMADLGRSDALRFWTPERVEQMGRLQQRMLVAAFKRLRRGGILVYSTCTVSPEENEAPIDHLLRHYPDARVEPIDLAIPEAVPGLARWQAREYHPDLRYALRVVPTPFMEAFFVCRIRKSGEGIPGVIELVATPIGNLEDLSPRARSAFEAADVVACEDTRRTGRLLSAAGVKTRMVTYHDHNERQMAATLVRWAAEGKRVAVATDGGTPGVSDPGFTLVRAAAHAGVAVSMVPGPAAFVMAAVLSGLPVHGITFRGFAPKKGGPRRRFIEVDAASPHTLVFYESPYRVAKLIEDAIAVLGDRPAAFARELTKLHEEVVRGRLSELAAVLEARGGQLVGECCLVIAGAEVPADWFEAEEPG